MRVSLKSLELNAKSLRKLIDLVQTHENDTEKGYHVRWQREDKAPGLSQEVTVRYDHIDNFLHFQSSFLPTRKQNKEYLIGLLSRLIKAASASYGWEKGIVYMKNGIVEAKNQNLHIEERKNRYTKCGVNTEDKTYQKFLNKDPWVTLNSESEHVSKIDQMAEKIKLYEEYAEQNMEIFDLKLKK